jgi:hypothetical protein
MHKFSFGFLGYYNRIDEKSKERVGWKQNFCPKYSALRLLFFQTNESAEHCRIIV